MEPMTTRVEVWPVAADEAGLWLLSGVGAWRSALALPADSEPHAEVECLLGQNEVLADTVLMHSTSWRIDGAHLVLTYMAVVRRPGFARRNWPGAEPISPRLPGTVGRPLPHGAAEPPLPREVDVLLHGLRHLRFLLDTDDSAVAVMDGHWRRHLAEMEPALAGMYSEVHQAA